MIRSISITIKGSSPLLMHRFPLVPEDGISKRTPEEQAESSAYRAEDGMLFFPGTNIQRGFISAAAFSKGKGRASLQKVAAACLLVTPEVVSFGTKHYAVDSRAVVVPATRGRVVRHRPRLNEWALSFTLEYDADLLSEKEVRQIVDDCGTRVGLGDFRPERRGPFGRFMVTEFKTD